MTVIIKDPILKKAIDEGNYKCVSYIKAQKDVSTEDFLDTVRHLFSVFRVAYADAGQYPEHDELVGKLSDELGLDWFSRSVVKQHLEGEQSNDVFYCSKIRSLYRIPETVCQTCKIYKQSSFSEPKKVIDYVIQSIREVTSDGETVTVYISSERAGGASIPYKLKYEDIIRFVQISTPVPDSKSWERAGRPVIVALTLFNIASGEMPMAQLSNIDTRPLWIDIIKRMKLEIDDPSEVVRIIKELVEESIPDDLNDIDPNNHALTPSLLEYYAKKGEVLSPKIVIKERSGLLRVWIHSKFLQNQIALALGREANPKQLKSIILDLGGSTSAKLGTTEFRNLRGFEIPSSSFDAQLRERIKKYYKEAEDLGEFKLKQDAGGGSDA